MVTDGFLDKTYPFTREEGDPMKEKPKRPETLLTDRRIFLQIFFVAVFMGFSQNPLYYWRMNPYTVTMAFVGVLAQMVVVTFLQDYFHITDITPQILLYSLLVPSGVFFLLEFRKWFTLWRRS